MTGRADEPSRPMPGEPKPRLVPPPRVRPPSSPPPEAGSRPGVSTPSPWARWATAVLFILLTTAAVVVFAVLPDWVETGRVEVGSPPAVESLPAESLPVESPVGSLPVEALPTELRRVEPLPAERPVEAPLPTETLPVESRPVEVQPAPRDPAPRRSRRTTVSVSAAEPAVPSVDETFQREMSTGLAALREEDFAAAEEAFKRAAALRETPAVTDGLAQAKAGLRRLQIAELHEQARELEEREAWQDAFESYEALTAIDATLAFARDGLARARERAELAERLDFHLAHAERLSAEAVLDEARAVRDRARALAPQSPSLDRRAAELDRLIAAYSRSVAVTIESDQLTEVTIYRVARLGRFRQRQLALRPGTYTVVGTRSGYRDVRRQWVIPADGQPEPLVIRCEERL